MSAGRILHPSHSPLALRQWRKLSNTLSLPHPSKSYLLEKLYEVVGTAQLTNAAVKSHAWLCDLEILPRRGRWHRKMGVRNWQHPDVIMSAPESLEAQTKVIDHS